MLSEHVGFVRRSLGIQFAGETRETIHTLLDVEMTGVPQEGGSVCLVSILTLLNKLTTTGL